MSSMYNLGSRQLQDRFDSQRIADITVADSRGTRKTYPAVDWVSRTPW